MATYPSDPRLTTVRELNPIRRSITDDGTARFQDRGEDRATRITIVHDWITSTVRDSLLSFYTTNKLLSVAIAASDGITYDAFYIGYPAVAQRTGTFYRLTAILEGNPQ
jgi:hypothetical protein